jgi:hypothetical protein
MKKLYSILIFFFCIYSINSQDNKLVGTTISSNDYVGLELSTPSRITKISVTSQNSGNLLGVFQGANEKNFFDGIPLYMIKDSNQLNNIEISCTQSFKYVRFVDPQGKTPSIQFEVYGAAASDGEGSNYYQPTNLPLFIVNSGDNQMPQGKDRNTKTNVNYIMISEGKINAKQTGTIKLRGNSSLNSEKKPYLVKLEEKTKILDMPANAKKWVLVPNMYDKSLLRNLLGYEMSFIFGLKFTPSCRFIDLIVNGNYRGNYMICDKIQVSDERLALSKMDPSCNQEPEITGGYLIEGQGSKRRTDPSLFKSSKGITFSYEYPDIDDITEQQKSYIKNKFDEVEAQIYAGNADNVDLESFARYFLVEDFSGNQDFIFNSFYLFKERADNKFYFGPVWDFDLAFDNAQILYPTNEKKNFSYKFGLSNGSMNKLISQLLAIPQVLQKVKDTWNEMTNTKFTKEIIRNFLNKQIELINESQKLNFMKWDVLNSRQFMEAATRGSFEAEVNYLKEFVENRFDVFGNLVSSATTESVLEETQGSWGFPWGGGNNPWGGNGDNPWGGNGDNPWGGNGDNPWGGNGDNPWGGNGDNPWGGNGGNGDNPWGGNGNNQWGGNGDNQWGGN